MLHFPYYVTFFDCKEGKTMHNAQPHGRPEGHPSQSGRGQRPCTPKDLPPHTPSPAEGPTEWPQGPSQEDPQGPGREQRLSRRAPRAQLSGPKQEGPKRETQGPARTPTPGRPRPAARDTQGHPSRGPDQVTPGTQPGGPDQEVPSDRAKRSQGPSYQRPTRRIHGEPGEPRAAQEGPQGGTKNV